LESLLMMKTPLTRFLAGAWATLTGATLCLAAGPVAATRPAHVAGPVRAELRADQAIVQAGQPVWVTFTLTNLTDQPVTLKVPATAAAEEPPGSDVALPLAHVFSGPHDRALFIRDDRGEEWDQQVSIAPRGLVPVVRLAPFGSIGLRLELTRHYPALKRAGKYTLVWRPYDGAFESAPLQLNLLAERQAVILTEFGKMTLRFYYREAPQAVSNFIELAEQRFYENLTFHRIVPYTIIQGGDPRGDGRGVRPDGKRIPAEFSDIPFETGTVAMARLPSDPDSASCQFFICASRQPKFDGNETAFAYLYGEESFETLRKITSVPTDRNDRPRRPVIIRTITLENVPGAIDYDALSASPSGGHPATRPAIMPDGPRPPRGLSQLDGRRPASRPTANGG
jgi:cyclophilin family peptidyl-prolyl cis-trans isomerase